MQVGLLLGLRQNRWDNSLLRWVVSSGCLLWPGVVMCTLALRRLEPLEKTARRGAGSGSSFSDEELDRRVCRVKVRWWLAGTLEVQAVVTAIGAGMTVKYFPLFFKSDYHFSPIAICILNVVLPLCMSATVQVGIVISRRIGRLQASLLVHFLGTACLWSMSYCRSLPLVLPIFVLRGALMNSKVRGRWASMRWACFSAATADKGGGPKGGALFDVAPSAPRSGYIADASGDYRVTFAVTASIYTFSFLIMVPLLLICPADRPARAAADGPAAAQPTAAAPAGAGGAVARADAGVAAAAAAAPLLDGRGPPAGPRGPP
ncbi:unnamed protein product [Prorocentrum cordatum]|uniref:ADP,ATP carrier protein n=1 Tax=Prorocentrum cordatum TaxID=2364126 RepID=A0ABN9VQU5_9DINO|nr:unnamed protein product [Polarella glacialis]